MSTDTADVPTLKVGPLLRYVDDTRATVWVETDRPCTVEVLGTCTPTWTVHGHHFALVVVTGLTPGVAHAYDVRLDEHPVWPPPPSDDPAAPGATFPPSVIRTLSAHGALRLAFGSCRRAAGSGTGDLAAFGADALAALAERMVATPHGQWPDALFLAGDQVYADEPSEELRSRLRQRHGDDPDDPDGEVTEEIHNFEEYTWLYHESWNTPAVRWLLSTVPSCMLLDDHDLRDDWNTSWAWRESVTSQPWWRDRVTGAFASYWIYQHLGNMAPTEIADDPTFLMVTGTSDDDERSRLLDEFAWRSDAEPDSARWSFVRDFTTSTVLVRMLALDSRCSRRLEPDRRAMVDDSEWAWFVEHATGHRGDRPVDHLLIGTTLPFLLLHGIHHLEGWDEALAAGAWGRAGARLGEKVRQAVDLEHWAAFRYSFARFVSLLEDVCTAPAPPASVLLLSGDVHCSYTARAELTRVEHAGTVVHQLTMSPFRNPLELPIRLANRAFETRPVRALFGFLARRAGVAAVDIDWNVDEGPWFDNGVMTVVVDGRGVLLEVDHAVVEDGRQILRRTLTRTLTA